MAVHIHPIVIPPKYYKQIGRIIAGWNLTEALIQSIIWDIHKIKSPKRGRLFTMRPSAQEKLNIFEVTIKNFASSSQKATLTRFKGIAKGLKKKRNMVAHGLWGRMPKEHTTWKVFFSSETSDSHLLKRETLTIKNVESIADQIDKLNREIKGWMAANSVPPP